MPKRSRVKIFSFISIVIAIIIGIQYLGWLQPIDIFVRSLIAPTSQIVYDWSVTIKGNTDHFHSVNALQQAYTNLKKQYIASEINQTDYTQLQQKNALFKQSLHFFSSHSYSFISMNVIGQNIDPLGSSIIIDGGTKQHIKIGDPVVVQNGVLIGTVSRVEAHTTIVRLLDDHQSIIASTINNIDGSIGLIEGGYGTSLHMGMVPQNQKITIGDMVITSGLQSQIPRGLLIGKIEAVEKEAYQPFQTAFISPLVQLQRVITVSIILDTSTSTIQE